MHNQDRGGLCVPGKILEDTVTQGERLFCQVRRPTKPRRASCRRPNICWSSALLAAFALLEALHGVGPEDLRVRLGVPALVDAVEDAAQATPVRLGAHEVIQAEAPPLVWISRA